MVGAYYGAHLVALEHRFYGDSIPTDLTTEELVHLNSEQALSDIAGFIRQYNQFNPERQVIVVGGSYPGALSAWFRERYPHLADASWASSGVVYPIQDFWKFDEQIYTSTRYSGDECPALIQNITAEMDKALLAGGQVRNDTIHAMGAYAGMENFDFSFFFADIFVESVQYGNRTDLCDLMNQTANLTFSDKLPYLRNFSERINVGPSDYCRHNLQNPNTTSVAGRSWTYQYCTEFGFFQVPSQEHPMRSRQFLNESSWSEYCNDIFGTDLKVNRTIGEYAFRHTAGSNTIFTNGWEDPWQWATELNPNARINQQGSLANCTDCGHCGDLYTPLESDPWELNAERNSVLAFLDPILTSDEAYFI